MLDFDKITQDKLLDSDLAKEFLAEGEALYSNHEFGHAYTFAKGLETKLNLRPGKPMDELERKYFDLMVKLKFLGMHHLNDSEMIELFTNYLSRVLLDESLVLTNRFKARMISSVLPRDRDAFRERLIRALLRSTEKLTDKEIKNQESRKEGTVGNWLNDFLFQIGEEEEVTLAIADYYSKLKSHHRLSDEDTEKVKKIINFFDFLSFSSLTPTGIEETLSFYNEKGEFIDFSEGKVTVIPELSYDSPEDMPPIPPEKKVIQESVAEEAPREETPQASEAIPASVPSTDLADLPKTSPEATASKGPASVPSTNSGASAGEGEIGPEKIMAAYQGDSEEWQKIQAQEKQYASSDFNKLSQELHQVIFRKDKIQLLAVLRALAKAGQLDQLLSEDKKAIELFQTHLQRLQKPDLLAGFKVTPTREDFMVLWLRYILENIMSLPENEAARIGMQLGNLMRQAGNEKYMKMAYFDSGGGEFRWK